MRISLIKKQFFVLLLLLIGGTQVIAQTEIDTRGKDFYFTFSPNIGLKGFDPKTGEDIIYHHFVVYVSSQVDTNGTLIIDGLNYRKDFTVKAGKVTSIVLPPDQYRVPEYEVSNMAIRVKTEDEVSVYGLNYIDSSSDAFTAIPIDSLGKEYFAVGYAGAFSSPSSPFDYQSDLTVIAVEDNTKVEITPSVETDVFAKGEKITLNLNSGEVYRIEAKRTGAASLERDEDLTGSHIIADKPIGVMSGAMCAYVPKGLAACDHIVEMMAPISAWGKTAISVPVPYGGGRVRRVSHKVIASEDNTTVYEDGELLVKLNRGEDYEFARVESPVYPKATYLYSDKPILMMQYHNGGVSGHNGDPSMTYIAPNEQFQNEYVISTVVEDVIDYSRIKIEYEYRFISLVINKSDLGKITLNGNFIDTSKFIEVKGTDYYSGSIELEQGSYHLKADNPFGVYVHGQGDYVSYGYTGGFALKPINVNTDGFTPFIKTITFKDRIEGIAADFEDLNLNGLIDLNEDTNGNNILDFRTEDRNGNGQLDDGEDINNNGILDTDTGVFEVKLASGSTNLKLDVDSFVPGAQKVNFTITLLDQNQQGAGQVVVTDGGGNTASYDIQLDKVQLLQDVTITSRLIGIGVELDESSLLKQPSNINRSGNETTIEWKFDAFDIGQIETLDYEVTLKDPKPNETRTITQSLELRYLGVDGNPVFRKLGEQQVQVLPSIFSIQVTTDKVQYAENQTVLISPTVKNLTEFDSSANVRLKVLDSNNRLVKDLGVIQGFDVAASQSKVIPNISFASERTLTGDYFVVAEIIDANDLSLISDQAKFNIGASVQSIVTVNTTTDKPVYHTTDSIEVSQLVQNQSKNKLVKNAQLEVQIINSSGVVVFEETKMLGDLTPEYSKLVNTTYQYQKNESGIYTVKSRVFNQDGNLATNAVDVTIGDDLIKSLLGEVSIVDPSRYIGEPVQCQTTVKNIGVAALSNLNLRTIVADYESQTELASQDNALTLERDAQHIDAIEVDTASFSTGVFVCALQIKHNDAWHTLDYETFTLSTIELSAKLGTKGRILVLLDDSKYCTDEPDGPYNAPDLIQQQQLLEAVLKKGGWSLHYHFK